MGRFTIEELTATSVSSAKPNTPDDATIRANLDRLNNNTLTPLYERVGPFKIVSAFRSEEVNQIVGGSTSSFHRHGMAADIEPTMGADLFFAKILADPALRSLCGEVILNSSRILHVSSPATKNYRPMRRVAGVYEAMTDADIQDFVQKHGLKVAAGIGGALAVGALAFFALRGR